MTRLHVHPEVRSALAEGRPVVALESAVITHGLPRTRVPSVHGSVRDHWAADLPANLAAAEAMESAVRAVGAVPAMIALLDGTMHVGLEPAQRTALAACDTPWKLSTRDLAPAMSQRATGGTTVAATSHIARMLVDPPIEVFATGGIGGVHPGWSEHPDISADLGTLARTPICVISAGAKSILDLRATLEALDTLGVPVVGVGCSHFPQFIVRMDSDLTDPGMEVPHRVDDPCALAEVCALHWGVARQRSAVLAVQPMAAELSLDPAMYAEAASRAEKEAARQGIDGPERTPFLLSRLAELTGQRSLQANIALLINNAMLAASVAVELTKTRQTSTPAPEGQSPGE